MPWHDKALHYVIEPPPEQVALLLRLDCAVTVQLAGWCTMTAAVTVHHQNDHLLVSNLGAVTMQLIQCSTAHLIRHRASPPAKAQMRALTFQELHCDSRRAL